MFLPISEVAKRLNLHRSLIDQWTRRKGYLSPDQWRYGFKQVKIKEVDLEAVEAIKKERGL